jgi:hypothetical protein
VRPMVRPSRSGMQAGRPSCASRLASSSSSHMVRHDCGAVQGLPKRFPQKDPPHAQFVLLRTVLPRFHGKVTYVSDPLGAELAAGQLMGGRPVVPLAGCAVCTHNSQRFRSSDQKTCYERKEVDRRRCGAVVGGRGGAEEVGCTVSAGGGAPGPLDVTLVMRMGSHEVLSISHH